MINGIPPKGRTNGLIRSQSNLFKKRVCFTYSGIVRHEFKIPDKGIHRSFTLQKPDLVNINRELNRPDSKVGQTAEVNYFGDLLTFSVSAIEAQDLHIELSKIEHTMRSPKGLHTLPSTFLQRLFFDRFQKEGLDLHVKLSEQDWQQVEITFMGLIQLIIEHGNKFEFKIEGGSAVERQKALIDLFEAMRHIEEMEIQEKEKENANPSIQNRFIFPPDFSQVKDTKHPGGFNVQVFEGELPHTNLGDISSSPGRIETWSYYKDFNKAKQEFAKKQEDKIDGSELGNIFREVIQIYKTAMENEDNPIKKEDWSKFVVNFESLQKDLFERLDNDSEITFSFLEDFIEERRKEFTFGPKADSENAAKVLEDIDLAVNYIVKGLLQKGCDKKIYDNKMSITDKPVILLALSLTPMEAEQLPLNTVLVLVSDMVANSHPELILSRRGIKLLRPQGGLRDLIINPSDILKDPEKMASIIIGEQKIWLNLGIPENLYQFLVYSKKIEEAEALRDLAMNGLPRRIQDGRLVPIKANVGSETVEQVKALFRIYRPNGIGLFRLEMREISIGRPLTEDELAEHVVGLCDAATDEVKGVKFQLPVAVRVTDVSAAGRRDKKKVPGIKNPNNLSGATFLLSEGEGRERLKRDLRSYLKANLKRPGQIRVMIPDIKSKEQYQSIRGILQEIKEELSQELKVSMEKLIIPLAPMIESKQAANDAEALTKEGHFCSFGMNDFRESMGHPTILDKESLKLIYAVIQEAKKTSTPVSTCGKIANLIELEAMMALGMNEVSVDFADIPKWSGIIRSFHNEALELVKKEILAAESAEAIVQKLEANLKNMDSRLHGDAEKVSALGFNLQHQETQARFNAIHSTKSRIIDKFLQIAGDDQPEKVKRFISFFKEMENEDIQKEYNFSVCKCDPEDVARWLDDEMLFLSYLDGWELKEVLGKDCRMTPYIYHRGLDGTLWGRAIPQGIHKGTNSRYYISQEVAPSFPGQESAAQFHFRMNYFSLDSKTTESASCPVKKMKGYEDRYSVAVPIDQKGNIEIVDVLERTENGNKVLYRKLTGEKLYVAQIMLEGKKVISHPAITKYETKKLLGILISDRGGLGELAAETGVPDIPESFRRDSGNVFYHSKDPQRESKYNVNQCMYMRTKQIDPNTISLEVLDNWKGNGDEGFTPLLDDPKQLIDMMNFLSSEIEKGEAIQREMEEKMSLKSKVQSLQGQLNTVLERAKELGIDLSVPLK